MTDINSIVLPSNWLITSLDNICEILDSKRIPINNTERSIRIAGKRSEQLYPYYGATGKVGEIDDFIFEGEYVLVGEDGAPFLEPAKSKAYIATGKFWVNNHAHILKSYTSNKYLCHFLNQFNYSNYVTGTTRLKLNQAALKRIPVVFPPFNEQKRIVAKIEELFSELDNGIAALKAAREQLKVYRQTVLKYAFEGKLTDKWREKNTDKLETPEQLHIRIQQERNTRYHQQLEEWKAAVKKLETNGNEGKKPGKPKEPNATVLSNKSNFDIPSNWATTNLGLIAEVSGGLTKNQKRNTLPIKMKYLRVANVYADELLLDDIQEIGVTDIEEKKVLLIKNDLLVVEGNGSVEQIGRVAMWDANISGCGHQNHLIKVRLDNPEYARFILLFLLSPVGRDLIVKEASSTSGLHTLSISKVSNLQVPLVTLNEAKLLISIVDEKMILAAKLEEDVQTELKRAEALRQSILKKAFSGNLVPQDLNDEPASILLERIKIEIEQQKAPAKKSATKTIRKKVSEEICN